MDETRHLTTEPERGAFSMRPLFSVTVIAIAVAIGAGSLVREKERLAAELPLSSVMDSSGRADDPEELLSGLIDFSPPGTVTAAPALPSPRVSLTPGRDLRLILNGTVPTEEMKRQLFEAARKAAPELARVDDRVVVDPAVDSPPWLPGVPDLLGNLIATVQEPELRVDRTVAWIGGATDDKPGLKALRDEYQSLFSTRGKASDRLEFDETKPAPAPLLPLVLYMGTWEGKYLFEGSLPTLAQREAIRTAAIEVMGEKKVEDKLRVSARTVDEPWISMLPSVVSFLLKEGTGTMELVIADRTLSLSGELPGAEAKAKLLNLLEPVRSGGYEIRDELKIRNLKS